jgi:superfamily II DNA or RNA helicase
MHLRKHQSEFADIIDGIISGSPIRNIYCHCTPGSGKSLLPVLAGKLIEAGKADKLMWAAPRLSLLDQGEREFINPAWREYLGHRIKVRSSTNEVNPCRGLDGICTTMQAVGLDEGILPSEFQRRRYILILDEGHHIATNSLWERKFKELWDLATYRIFLSGTLERGDGEKIAFLPYKMNGSGLIPDLRDTEDTAVIHYTRADALAEQAIIPLSFHLSDGRAEWQEKTGKKKQVASLDKMTEGDAAKAIYTALKTEYADDLLSAGLSHWMEHRRQVKGAKCLIVTSNIEEAKRHTKTLKAMGIRAALDIATSEDSLAALKVINGMKTGKVDILVTVAMAYEGLSIPAVSHIICLTRIRSTPWIEQMTARANRIDPNAGPYDTQMGHIFAPADPLFKEIVARIEAEQLPFLEERKSAEKGKKKLRTNDDGFFLTPSPGGITALSSEMTGKREVILGNGNGHAPERTASEIETDLLEQIESHIRNFSYQNRYNPKRINGEVYQAFGKPRREMTIPELKQVLKHVQSQYPLSRIRGTGHPRVSTKAQPLNVTWK